MQGHSSRVKENFNVLVCRENRKSRNDINATKPSVQVQVARATPPLYADKCCECSVQQNNKNEKNARARQWSVQHPKCPR